MVSLNIGNVLKLPQILKIPELLMGFIILVIARAGYKGDQVADFYINGGYLSILVSYGYFLIVLVQLLGILLGDKTPISDALFSLIGFLLFLSAGSLMIADAGKTPLTGDIVAFPDYVPSQRALGSMQILNSLIYLVDFVFSAMNVVNKKE